MKKDLKMMTGHDIFSLEEFSKFRGLAKSKGYGGPMVPAVGADYGTDGMPKLVYCGVATRERFISDVSDKEAYEDAVRHDQTGFEDVPIDPGSSGFWHAGLAVARTVGQHFGLSLEQAWKRMAWTNLSKLCLGTETGPPPEDLELRKLDVAQVRKEWERLAPDVFICAAGNHLVDAGHELFGEAPGKTAIGDLPKGGKWIWTMHPNRKSIEWRDKLAGKVLNLLN
jgi:hypothetical protein